MHVNEKFKNRNKAKSRHIQIENLAHKKCNGIIKGWRHYLMSESGGRFLVNNILMFGSARLVIAQIQFSLMKKIKTGRPEHSLTPPPPPPKLMTVNK